MDSDTATAGSLGFDRPLKALLLVGIALVGLGQILDGSTGFMDVDQDPTSLETTSQLMIDLGSLVGATALLLAALRADSAQAGIRALMVFLGVVLIFSGLEFSFLTGFRG